MIPGGNQKKKIKKRNSNSVRIGVNSYPPIFFCLFVGSYNFHLSLAFCLETLPSDHFASG